MHMWDKMRHFRVVWNTGFNKLNPGLNWCVYVYHTISHFNISILRVFYDFMNT